jgi:signal recognition particle subunit SRP54
VVIIDTAGRLAIDEAMMVEIEQVKAAVKPHEILFVVDSMTGQDAVNTAKVFNDRLDFTGVVLTKLDGDTRGGAALIYQIGSEQADQIYWYRRKDGSAGRFPPRSYGIPYPGHGRRGIVVERAQQQFDEKEAAELQKKIRKNKFDFNDFYSQIQQIKKMGNMKDLMGMIPGVGKMMKDVEVDDDAFKAIEAIIQSMTPFEKENPETINQSRRTRIAKGSGTDLAEVNRLMKQFDDMKKVMKQMSNPAAMASMMRRMPKM